MILVSKGIVNTVLNYGLLITNILVWPYILFSLQLSPGSMVMDKEDFVQRLFQMDVKKHCSSRTPPERLHTIVWVTPIFLKVLIAPSNLSVHLYNLVYYSKSIVCSPRAFKVFSSCKMKAVVSP